MGRSVPFIGRQRARGAILALVLWAALSAPAAAAISVQWVPNYNGVGPGWEVFYQGLNIISPYTHIVIYNADNSSSPSASTSNTYFDSVGGAAVKFLLLDYGGYPGFGLTYQSHIVVRYWNQTAGTVPAAYSSPLYANGFDYSNSATPTPGPSPSPSPSPSVAAVGSGSITAWQDGGSVYVHGDGMQYPSGDNAVDFFYYLADGSLADQKRVTPGTVIGSSLANNGIRRVAVYSVRVEGPDYHLLGAVDVARPAAVGEGLVTAWRKGSDVVVRWDGAVLPAGDNTIGLYFYGLDGVTVAAQALTAASEGSYSTADVGVRRVVVYSWNGSNRVDHLLGAVDLTSDTFTPDGTLGGLTPDAAGQVLGGVDQLLNLALVGAVGLLVLKWFARAAG